MRTWRYKSLIDNALVIEAKKYGPSGELQVRRSGQARVYSVTVSNGYGYQSVKYAKGYRELRKIISELK